MGKRYPQVPLKSKEPGDAYVRAGQRGGLAVWIGHQNVDGARAVRRNRVWIVVLFSA